jgi:subtilisin family serine protease
MNTLSNNDVAKALKQKEEEVVPAPPQQQSFHIENTFVQWASAPTDKISTALYDFQYLKLIAAWRKYGLQGQEANVTVIDTGIAPHNAFAHTKILQRSTVKGDKDPLDTNGHGTWVCGKIVGVGVGIAPKCNLTSYRTLDANGSGSVEASTAALSACLDDCDLVNMSLGSPFRSDAQERIIGRLAEDGVLVVAAAGNYDTDQPFYPGSFDACLTVAATDARRSKAEFSNYGGQIDIVAPGVSCYSTFLNNQFRCMSGTSMAAPIVTGVLALGVSYLKVVRKISSRKERSKLLLAALQSTVCDLGVKGKDAIFGFGSIDALSFLDKLHST